jgi:hypothetical protein
VGRKAAGHCVAEVSQKALITFYWMMINVSCMQRKEERTLDGMGFPEPRGLYLAPKSSLQQLRARPRGTHTEDSSDE